MGVFCYLQLLPERPTLSAGLTLNRDFSSSALNWRSLPSDLPSDLPRLPSLLPPSPVHPHHLEQGLELFSIELALAALRLALSLALLVIHDALREAHLGQLALVDLRGGGGGGG